MLNVKRDSRALLGSVAAMLVAATPIFAQGAFEVLDRGFDGNIRFSGQNREPITAGTKAVVSGSGLIPGQKVTLRQNSVVLNPDAPYVADDEGNFEATLAIPASALPGTHPVLAEISDPSYGMAVDLKVSPVLEESGDFVTFGKQLVRGLYQVAQSDKLGAVYVTAAVGRPPVKESTLLKLDPETFEVLAQVAPAPAPAREDGSDSGLFAVYGVGVDEPNNQVWVTNTRQNTVAVYSAEDLSLVKQFSTDTVGHPRDVVVFDGKAYVSATFEPLIHVFDTETLEELAPIELSSSRRRAEFGTASLQLDPAAGAIYVVSLTTNEVAVVDLSKGKEVAVYPVDGSESTIGVGHDPKTNRIFTAGQGSDNVMILDGDTGEVLHEVLVGANPLNIAFDPVTDLAYVAVRASGTVVMITPNGEVVGNIAIGSFPNHLTVDGNGGVLVVNKAKDEDDPTGDHITRITPAS
ncbi:ATP-binding protein [Qingshengfaniella alkalisoli]|uniref:ATP-binding protein n=1 Tax=Qingshengfaniella alkalisoli TaxID=2599296 RepID=A0A5B8IZB4_9RHOB|nr:ATP-binding protein [Qingshengfaniella alkalisoli]QDY71034.1 ATP-binding protein [Qingshengfaniella alkalisoli]